MRGSARSLIILLTLFLSLMGQADSFKVPRLTGPVVDNANLISSSAERSISSALRELNKTTGTQITVLTVSDLGGLPIEQASIQVTDSWKLGSKDQDRGLLLLIAKEERKVRIEVGQGLEGSLTDLHSKRIIDYKMVPHFKRGAFDLGIVEGLSEIISKTDPNYDFYGNSNGNKFYKRNKRKSKSAFIFTIFLIFMLIRLFFGRSRIGGFGGYHGGYSGSGGWSSGGGGWSGGGGGFSGGGASGSW